jgi:hypothetical protein
MNVTFWIDYLWFYVPLKNFSLIWRRHHYRWRAAKFRPILGAQGPWGGRDLYRATHAATRGLGFSGLIRRTTPFSRLLRHTRGCGEPILTRIPMGRLFGILQTSYLKNLLVVEFSHFSSMFWINCIYRHQLITVTIMGKCFRVSQTFLFSNQFGHTNRFHYTLNYPQSKSAFQKLPHYRCETCQTIFGPMKVCIQDCCNDNRFCKTPT